MSERKEGGNAPAPDIALLIIDMQNACRDECRYKEEFDSAADYINEASRLFREKGAPVVMIHDKNTGGGPDTKGYEVIPGIKRADTDIVLEKPFNNAFCKTELADILRERGVRFVVLSGFAAEYCVVFSYNGAVESGFRASLLQHGVAGDTPEGIRGIQLLRPVISLQALAYIFNK